MLSLCAAAFTDSPTNENKNGILELSIRRFNESSAGFVNIGGVMLSHFFWQGDL